MQDRAEEIKASTGPRSNIGAKIAMGTNTSIALKTVPVLTILFLTEVMGAVASEIFSMDGTKGCGWLLLVISAPSQAKA